MEYILCLDIGGTKISGALIKNGRLFSYRQAPTHAKQNNQIIIATIFDIVQTIKGDKKIKSINIGMAGHVNHQKGILITSPNFNKKFKNINLKKILSTKFKVLVFVDNDANCFALGEAVYGQGKKYKLVVGITLGTGIGGGIIINKKIYHGKNNLAGEFGHCFLNQSIFEKNNFSQPKNLALLFHSILHNYDPDIIIVGGGISNEPNLIAKAGQELKKLLYYQAIKQTPVKKSNLKNKANLLGAYLLNNKKYARQQPS